jgi:hypothetical protein
VGPAGIEPTTSTVESRRFEDENRPLAPVTPITAKADRASLDNEPVTIKALHVGIS